MILSDFLPILIQIVLAVGMGVGILVASHILDSELSEARSRILLMSVECHLKLVELTATQLSFM